MNKMQIISRLLPLALCLGALCLSSCDDDEQYDVVGQQGSRVYVNFGSTDGIRNLVGAAEIIHTPVGEIGGNMSATFAVSCAGRPAGPVEVSFAYQPDEVAAFNERHETSYAALPEGCLEMGVLRLPDEEGNRELNTARTTVGIPAGELKSADSLTLRIPERVWASLTEPAYLVPVRIASVSGAQIAANEGFDRVYMVVKTSVRLVNPSPTEADFAKVKLCEDRSAWSAELADGSTSRSGAAENLFDGNTSSAWNFTSPYTFVVDLGAEHRVAGVQLFCQYANYGTYYRLGSWLTEYSTDNETWESFESGTPYADGSGVQSVLLYGYVEARYLKLTLRPSYFMGLTEMNIYEAN